MRIKLLGVALALSAVLTSCAWGVTTPPQSVTSSGATLTGDVHNTITGATEYWYEYGPTIAYGSSTPHQSVEVTETFAPHPVTELIGDLAPGTTHHARLCARAATGNGLCGADQRFTTAGPRDSVTGSGTVFTLPQLGYVIGGAFDVSADPDGTDAVGSATTAPGVFYFKLADHGPAECLRVQGNRATVGFVSDPAAVGAPPEYLPVFILAFIEDNGPTGDRFGLSSASDPIPCPAATDSDFSDFTVGGIPVPPTVTSGDFVVGDAPSPPAPTS